MLDFPTAWRLCKSGAANPHDPRCSFIVTTGALLCDCGAVEEAYKREAAGDPEFEACRHLLGEHCACVTKDDGWRPCTIGLCERPDHDHANDPACSGAGYAHAPHGNCSGYSTDRT